MEHTIPSTADEKRSLYEITLYKGRTEGVEEGKKEGRKEALLSLVARRFGAAQATELTAMTDLDELERRVDALLGAPAPSPPKP